MSLPPHAGPNPNCLLLAASAPKPRRGPSRGWSLPALLLCALSPLAPLGCGHPATVKECDEIVERIARLELEQQPAKVSSDTVTKDVQATQKALRDRTMRDCVGKRITEDAMQCVRNAKTTKELVEECFN